MSKENDPHLGLLITASGFDNNGYGHAENIILEPEEDKNDDKEVELWNKEKNRLRAKWIYKQVILQLVQTGQIRPERIIDAGGFAQEDQIGEDYYYNPDEQLNGWRE